MSDQHNTTDLPVLGTDQPLANLENDVEFYHELLTTFTTHAAVIVRDLLKALQSGELEPVAHKAHELKGAAASIGAQRFSDYVKTLHAGARDGSLPEGNEYWLEKIPAELSLVEEAIFSFIRNTKADMEADEQHTLV